MGLAKGVRMAGHLAFGGAGVELPLHLWSRNGILRRLVTVASAASRFIKHPILASAKPAAGRQDGRDVELWRGLGGAAHLARRNPKRHGRETPGRPGVPGARV